MPLPEPKNTETEKEYLPRCLSSDKMKTDFPKIKQRLAVCFSVLKRSKDKNGKTN